MLATITGTAYNDVNNDGVRQATESAAAGVTIYLDQNGNGKLDLASSPSKFNATDVPKAILDKKTAVSSLPITGLNGVASLSLTLNLTHTYDSDLSAVLRSPSGRTVKLFQSVGGSGDNFTNTTFSDTAAASIVTGKAPFTGSFRPLEPLSTFNGEDGNGTWTLEVTDSANGDQGTLLAWSLSIQSYAEANTRTSGTGTYSFNDLPAGNYQVGALPPSPQVVTSPGGDGRHRISLATSSSAASADFGIALPTATARGTVFRDLNQNGIRDAGEAPLAGTSLYVDLNLNGRFDGGEPTTVSAADGSYQFNGLLPYATYSVREVVPSGFVQTGPTAVSLAPNAPVNAGRRPGNQTETTVAINPTNPLNIVYASNTTETGTSQYLLMGVSFDGGATWSTRNLGNGADLPLACCDPSLAFDGFGNLFLSYLDSGLKAVVAVSADGGRTFRSLGRSALSADQPSIATGPGSVWLTYNQNGAIWAVGQSVTGLNQVNGFNFAAAQQAPLSNYGASTNYSGNFGDIAVGPDGAVAVAYQNAFSGQGPDTIYVSVDPDGLGSQPIGARVAATTTNVGGFDRITPQPNRSIDAEAGLAWDRSNGPHRGRLYLVYTDEPVNESNDTNVYVRYSDDKGATWSAPVKVNDDATAYAQFLPRIAVDPTSGNVAVSFYDARNSRDGTTVDYYAAVSVDGGRTFLANARLSRGASRSPDSFDFGDYTGMAFQGGRIAAAWGDDSNSTGDNAGGLDVYFGSAVVTASGAYTFYASPGQVASGLDFGNARVTSAQKVVDDGDWSFDQVGAGWQTVRTAGYLGDYRRLPVASQSAAKSARWYLQNGPGSYEVFVTWPVAATTNAPDALYTLLDGPNTIGTVSVDQRTLPSDAVINGVRWKSLGVVTLSTTTLQIILRGQAGGDVLADAAMLASPPPLSGSGFGAMGYGPAGVSSGIPTTPPSGSADPAGAGRSAGGMQAVMIGGSTSGRSKANLSGSGAGGSREPESHPARDAEQTPGALGSRRPENRATRASQRHHPRPHTLAQPLSETQARRPTRPIHRRTPVDLESPEPLTWPFGFECRGPQVAPDRGELPH